MAVVEGEVPISLRNIEIRSLDLGLLQAGAGVEGEFENRLEALIQEVKSSPTPIVLFIDEAHTLVGTAAQAGQNDAANLLKPALARGEIRTVAATTPSKSRNTSRPTLPLDSRFQEVKVDKQHAKAVTMPRPRRRDGRPPANSACSTTPLPRAASWRTSPIGSLTAFGNGVVEHADFVVAFEYVSEAAHHADPGDRLVNFHFLEAEVFLVFHARGGRGAHFAAGQRGLEQVGRVCPLAPAPMSVSGFVDEQNNGVGDDFTS